MDDSQSTGAGTGAGQVLAGRYRLSEAMGSGGMGKVWRAHDEVLHRTVAVKELTAGRYASDADRAVLHQRTQKEARAAARITHPGVVTVHDVLHHDDRPWIVMQYVDGPSLADTVKEAGRIDSGEAARIGLQVLGALRAAHAAGVLHRDVKPGNVLLARDGNVLLTDFGIAAIEGDSTITRTGEIVGSVDYLPPERVRGHDPGPASDLWALGATLYAAVQGGSPFRRNSALSTMQAVVTDEPPYPDHAGPLAPVIAALLAKDPAARPDAAAAEQMLREVLDGRARTQAYAYPHVQQQPPTQHQAQQHRAEQHRAQPSGGRAPSQHTPPAHTSAPRAAGQDQRSSAGRLPEEAAAPQHPAQGHGRSPAPPTASVPAPGQASRQRSRGRRRKELLAILLAAVVGGGAEFAAIQFGGGGSPSDQGAATAGPSASGGSSGDGSPDDAPSGTPDVPEGWETVHDDQEGFTISVPEGWERDTTSKTIDYTPDGGDHLIRISIDENPDFPAPEDHLRNLEKSLSVLKQYDRLQLGHYDFRDQRQSARWEFSWDQTADNGTPGPRHAVDHIYYADDDGVEYAIFMSVPEDDWATAQKQFETVLRNWQPTDTTD
ncbi:protein kinase [Streptomyces sp. NPDC088725]|uniref:serine/threonine-protein kinase n=1 Tax=Streptomyces sp. NPDC088725 TaxID=3365873 RepID=UPI0038003323